MRPTPYLLRASSILSLFVLAACSGAPDASDDSSDAVTVAPEAAKAGEYDRNDGRTSGSLVVKSADATSVEFSLSLYQQVSPYHTGDLSGRATGADGHYVYTQHDCNIDLTFRGATLDVKQDGACSGTMGVNVTADGSYKLLDDDATKLRAGTYDSLSIAVNDGIVTGVVRDSIGDPEHGGATCEFTISGKLGADQRTTNITATDAYATVQGKLVIRDARNVALVLPDLPSACGRMFPSDEFASEKGFAFKWAGLLDPGITGFRTVQAEKAHFHDAAGGPARGAYVVKGDTVQVVAGGNADWLSVVYSPFSGGAATKGFLAASDLVAIR